MPLAVATLALALSACQSAPRPAWRSADDPCRKLAYTFYVVAALEERGMSRAEQEQLARRGTAGAPATRSQWLRVVDLVYRYADGEPYEVAATVLDGCTVDEHGRAAVVTTLWPGSQAQRGEVPVPGAGEEEEPRDGQQRVVEAR